MDMGEMKASKKRRVTAAKRKVEQCPPEEAGTASDRLAFISGFPMDAETAANALRNLFIRAGMDCAEISRLCFEGAEFPDWRYSRENCRDDPAIAMCEIENVSASIIEQVLQWASACPETDRGRWAGRFLAETLIFLQKRKGLIASRSSAFEKRFNDLNPLCDLLHKQGGDKHKGPSPMTVWIIRAYERTSKVISSVSLFKELTELDPGVDYRTLLGCEDSEWIAKAFDEVLKHPKDKRQKPWFDHVIWPWLLARRTEIKSEGWAEDAIKKHGGRGKDQWQPSFSNLKSDFRKAWATFYNRPVGNVTGLERPPAR